MKDKRKTRKKIFKYTEADPAVGLTASQVEERVSHGAVNKITNTSTRSYGQIFVSNTFTFFNLLCVLVFVWMVSVAESFTDVKNMGFIVIITCNWLIGIVQEIRAKITVDKLTFISMPDVTVLRDGEEKNIPVGDLVLGDICVFSPGNQICADGVVTDGEAEVNESLLTGESEAIKKRKSDTCLSGSFVVSGKINLRLTAIASDCYINSLSKEAKNIKVKPSELIRSLNLIMKIIAIIIIPVGFLAFLSNFSAALAELGHANNMWTVLGELSDIDSAVRYEAYRNAVFPTSTSIIGMIPSGMFLLTSVALAVGIMRLAKKKALVQELYSIERLARVNLLCLDKTGTITDGTMLVKKVDVLSETEEKSVKKIISSMQAVLNENNPTATALQSYFGKKESLKALFNIPFSSDRKCSAVGFEDGTYVIGAPEYVGVKMTKTLNDKISKYMDNGYRCLMLAYNKKNKKEIIPKDNSPVALIVIEDNIKKNCVDTIKYFKDSGVDVRVISGDNPRTVSVIASRVGIDNADKYVSLHGMSDEEVRAIALDYTVFGRVNPAQKKLLVSIFKSAGRTVAMTGDGINDILAMKEADCSVAMANGSDATRSIANVVLLDSDFGSMPSIVAEGRRVINNIERSSTLFLTKTMFSLLFSLVLVIWNKSFPLDPIQISFVALFSIGLPSFFMALEPNNARIKDGFLKNVFKKIMPGAIATILAVMVVMIFSMEGELKVSEAELKTLCMIVMFVIFTEVACMLCKPYNTRRVIVMTVIVIAAIIVIIVSPYLPENLNIYNIYTRYDLIPTWLVISVGIMALSVMEFVSAIINRIDNGVNRLKVKIKDDEIK